MSYLRSGFCLSVFFFAVSVSSVRGEDSLVRELYGRAVHAYFSGQTEDAITLLTSALDGGSKDPRVYYFRGLALARSGREFEAKGDFMEGARLEARSTHTTSSVNHALERIQGTTRTVLEKARSDAKIELLNLSMSRNRVRYGTPIPSSAAPVISSPNVIKNLPSPWPETTSIIEPVVNPKETEPASKSADEPSAETEDSGDKVEPTTDDVFGESGAEKPRSEDPTGEPATADETLEPPSEEPATEKSPFDD